MSCCWQGTALRSCSDYATHPHLDAGIGGIISEIHSRKSKFGYGKLGEGVGYFRQVADRSVLIPRPDHEVFASAARGL